MKGLLPIEIGGVGVREVTPGPMAALLPYQGKLSALSDAMQEAHGFHWPALGRSSGTADKGALWFGRDQALLIGETADAALAEHAAVVDQSDAWAVVEMSGTLAQETLARLTPIDLRASVFEVGHTARTELGHMAASITRIGPHTYRVMVFRAFGRTLLHEVTVALEGVAARRGG